ncbi:hypothetical protein [Leptolyngbya ohadii]|uniref:hypothetical protein n=1 Tax=Leptolyngbya ohadii TaxID=1962290 RepID=UPI001179CE4D|nr:hypothetical protein [Leptolyngbya ohadii]
MNTNQATGNVETFLETYEDESELEVFQRRDARRNQLEEQGLECRYENCYRITDGRRVLLLIIEKAESIPELETGKRIVMTDRTQPASPQQSSYRQSSLPGSGRSQRHIRQRSPKYETR